jgi:CBS domain containing-hemolysin-like protein
LTLILPLFAVALSTSASFFFSGVETGIYALNRVRLRLKVEEGDGRARRVAELIRRPQLLISSILIGNHVANYLVAYFFQGVVVAVLRPTDPEFVSTLILTPFLFVFGEITPKDVFRLRADDLVYRASLPLMVATVVTRPLALLLRGFGRMSRALPRSAPVLDTLLSRDRLESLVHEVAEEGVLTEEQGRMVRNVMRLSSVRVRDVMVPAERVDAVDTGYTREDLVRASARQGRTRIPVRDSGTGRFVGVVNVLDLLFRDEPDPGSLVRSAPALPADQAVGRALRTLRRAHQPLGIVTDADGATIGIATVKDLVEEVSGELPVF